MFSNLGIHQVLKIFLDPRISSQKLTINEHIEMRKNNDNKGTSDETPPEKHMIIASLTEGLRSIENGLSILKNIKTKNAL